MLLHHAHAAVLALTRHRDARAQRVFRVTFLQRPAIAKQRFTKRYRHPELDARLTKSRLHGVRRVPGVGKPGVQTRKTDYVVVRC